MTFLKRIEMLKGSREKVVLFRPPFDSSLRKHLWLLVLTTQLLVRLVNAPDFLICSVHQSRDYFAGK